MTLNSKLLATAFLLAASSTPAQEMTTLPPALLQGKAPYTLPMPQTPQAEAEQARRIAALREAFDALKQRDARNTALRQSITESTATEIQRVDALLSDTESGRQLAVWKAQNLGILARAMADAPPLALPQGLPGGTRQEIALAVIAPRATLYAQPQTDAQAVIRTTETLTTMLRVAELGAFTLVWSPQDRFAFVLNQFREIY